MKSEESPNKITDIQVDVGRLNQFRLAEETDLLEKFPTFLYVILKSLNSLKEGPVLSGAMTTIIQQGNG